MTQKISLNVITSEDCFACRQCCHFDPRYLDYAPLFTDVQRQRIVDAFADDALADDALADPAPRFTAHGDMWRIVLVERPDKYVCPLLEEDTGRCRVYAHGIFDCDTWPFEISRRDDHLLLTLAPGCPAADQRPARMAARGEQLRATMLAWVQRNPDNVHPYHESSAVLADLGLASALLSGRTRVGEL